MKLYVHQGRNVTDARTFQLLIADSGIQIACTDCTRVYVRYVHMWLCVDRHIRHVDMGTLNGDGKTLTESLMHSPTQCACKKQLILRQIHELNERGRKKTFSAEFLLDINRSTKKKRNVSNFHAVINQCCHLSDGPASLTASSLKCRTFRSFYFIFYAHGRLKF